jgi:hypothetical protein
MFALINIFIVVLETPTAPSNQSDLALLDMAAGHFAQMQVLTSSLLSFPFAREIASLARRTVSNANRLGSETSPRSQHEIENNQSTLHEDPDLSGNVTVCSFLPRPN